MDKLDIKMGIYDRLCKMQAESLYSNFMVGEDMEKDKIFFRVYYKEEYFCGFSPHHFDVSGAMDFVFSKSSILYNRAFRIICKLNRKLI